MFKTILYLVVSIFLFGACNSSQNTEKLTVASEKGDCIGVAPMKCLMVKKDGQRGWEFLYTEIEGIKYEPGYEYVIEVKKTERKNPAADQSAIKYTLVKEISKTQKTSEDLPQIQQRDTIPQAM